MIRRGCGLKGLGKLAPGSVDLALMDLPYGSTANPWDVRLDPAALWDAIRPALAPAGAVVAFADIRLAASLFASAPRGWFRYDLVWSKACPTGHLNANRQPLRAHELILVFSPRRPPYRPQMVPGEPYACKTGGKSSNYGAYRAVHTANPGIRYPTSILAHSNMNSAGKIHPTQKPLGLAEWIIETYSGPGALVVDPTLGSGTFALAAHRTGRRFVGWETDPTYHRAARRRLAAEKARSCRPPKTARPPAA